VVKPELVNNNKKNVSPAASGNQKNRTTETKNAAQRTALL
jgi:hypothetical protein